MMKKKKVLITAEGFDELCPEAKKLLEENGFEIVNTRSRLPFEELKKYVGDIDAALVGIETWDEKVFQLAPKLKVAVKFGVGVDIFDLESAKKHNIKICNTKGANSDSVAELTIALMLDCLRSVSLQDRFLRKSVWKHCVGSEMMNKQIGLLGFGAIGQKIAQKLSGFSVEISAYDKYPDYNRAKQLNVEITDCESLLVKSDIVCILLPSNKETYHFMNHQRFSSMKDGAIFINTARGNLVDEEALYMHLTSGKLSAAGLDVYQTEPDVNHQLFTLDNIVGTAHCAGDTYESYRRVGLTAARQIIDACSGEVPDNWLNP